MLFSNNWKGTGGTAWLLYCKIANDLGEVAIVHLPSASVVSRNQPDRFLNQVRTDHRPERTWFLKIDPVQIIGMSVRVCVCACDCVSAPEAINNYWRDMNLIRLVKQVLQLLYGNYSRYC